MSLISKDQIQAHNATVQRHADTDYEYLGEQLARRGVDIAVLKAEVAKFAVAVPSWGVGTGGTRFARFPGLGEPRHVFDKIQDCGVIQQLVRCTPTVSPHFPWDKVSDYQELRQHAEAHGVGFDAVNSNTFSDQKDQPLSYKFGSLTHSDAATRAQAVAHNIDCIEIGRQIGSQFYERTALSTNKAAMLEKGELAQPGDTITPEQAIKVSVPAEF